MRTIRNENLKKVIRDKFADSHPTFAKATGITMSQVGQWLAPEGADNSRNMSEGSARKIESKCLLPSGWMDKDHDSVQNDITPTIEENWPFQHIGKDEYKLIPADVREDIEDYIRMKLEKLRTARKSAA